MPESMDIVEYIDNKYQPKLIKNKGKQNLQLYKWIDESGYFVSRLAMPRWAKVNFEEFKTTAARNYFINKKESYMGSFEELIKNTPEYLLATEAKLLELEKLLFSTEYASKNELTEDDIILFPKLRSLSIVKDLRFPDKVLQYIHNMSRKSHVNLNLDIAL